ncbi:hypothetical protein CRYPA_1314 [uncultured Candidatus Thioglobus sp.]|nr:hypothetical protein CRYPA_1314 [uncultured Candidatus Thioglobus sp.]
MHPTKSICSKTKSKIFVSLAYFLAKNEENSQLFDEFFAKKDAVLYV